jgi:glycerol-3-phosphate acyltransferase PlsX
MLTQFARDEFGRNIFTKLSALAVKPALTAMRNRADPDRYNGASLLGLKGIVVKSHGSADADSFSNAISVAVAEVENKVPERIGEQIEKLLAGT